ncbi:PTS transporter subunit EIIC [Virgibacillus halophilus]|uniref:PTS transporter subunit EIIC n=1 Tax=Tigheibacillus halophilus TaxID=361280 RepID=A0ABU5C2W3_9BACI|nr:PTS transporter subunit EIIC [Virgibacillus halophilus]
MDDHDLAKKILVELGGKENIAHFTNCVTRLRVTVKNRTEMDIDNIKQLDGVLSVIDRDSIQIVLGVGKVTKVAKEFETITGIHADSFETDQQDEFNLAKDTHKSYKEKQTTKIQQILQHIGNIFIPLIPGFASSGLILGIANILSSLADAGWISQAVVNSNWFELFHMIGGLLYGSLAVFVGINTSREFKGTPVLGGIAGLLLYAPELSDIGSLNLIGLHLSLQSSLGGLLGVIIASYLFAKIEKQVRKIIPDIFDLLLTPLITLALGSIVTIVVIQPIAGILMDGVTWVLVDVMLKTAGALGGFVLSSTYLPVVTLGVHHGLIPVHLDLIEKTGQTSLLPILSMAGAGQVGAAFAIYFKTKDKRMRKTVASALPIGILGIGEPLIYGVMLPLGRPFITACLGAGFGGAFLTIFDVGAISYGPSGISEIPLIGGNKHFLYILGLLIAYTAGGILTYFFWV